MPNDNNCKPLAGGKNSCKSDHYLVKHNQDFAKFYTGRTKLTSIFPNICEGCLLAKYGLYEDYEEDAFFNIANCNFPTPKNSEGPYLKAYKPTYSLSASPYMVFERDTIIIPSGQLLVDILSSDQNFAFDRNFKGPTIEVKFPRERKTLSLNPNLYSYFRTLRDRHHNPINAKSLTKNLSALEQNVITNMHKVPNMAMLTYEGDMFFFGNLLTPDANESQYVQGKQLELSKGLSVKVHDRNPPSGVIEKMIDTKSRYVSVSNDTDSNVIPEASSDQIGQLNSYIKPLVLDVRQALVNKKPRLEEYFIRTSEEKSAVDLYVSSFCMPSQVGENPYPLRIIMPNCRYYEGIGLVATENICKTDFLVIDKSVHSSQLVALKMCNPENLIEYGPDIDGVPLQHPRHVPCKRGVQDTPETLPNQRALLYSSLMMK